MPQNARQRGDTPEWRHRQQPKPTGAHLFPASLHLEPGKAEKIRAALGRVRAAPTISLEQRSIPAEPSNQRRQGPQGRDRRPEIP